MTRRANRQRSCFQLILISFMLLGAAMFLKTSGAGQGRVNRLGFVYMMALPGAYLCWLWVRPSLPRK